VGSIHTYNCTNFDPNIEPNNGANNCRDNVSNSG